MTREQKEQIEYKHMILDDLKAETKHHSKHCDCMSCWDLYELQKELKKINKKSLNNKSNTV